MSENRAAVTSEVDSAGGVGKQVPKPRADHSGTPVEVIGTLTEKMGSGDNAKNSIVWMTITWSFSIATALSLLLFSLIVCYKDFSYLENIKSVWALFIPLITLALGYAFGRSK